MTWDLLFTNARLATMTRPPSEESGTASALAVTSGRIAWLGAMTDLPQGEARETRDLDGRWITPGLIDSHTHLVYGGDRAAEFELRLNGASYEEIARAGGGIISTVKATRTADEEALVASALPRLDHLLAEGVTTVEIKSGYGLTLADELKQLSAARRLGSLRPVSIATTFLGAHAVPPEYKDQADAYVELLCQAMPEVAKSGLADAVDAFCESIAFSIEQTDRVFAAAKASGLAIKLHADQLTDGGGAALAARYGALSADHLEYTGPTGVEAMAKAGTVAGILPGAFFVLREKQVPPIEAFRKLGVPMALATDSNPGSAPVTSLLLMLNMACTLFRMTVDEVLMGVTINAARALGLQHDRGTLEIGKRADLAVWSVERPGELAYRLGFNPIHLVVQNGTLRP